jgi:hypothetical protein
MLPELSVSSSGLSFSNSNYNYDNTNTNVSSHLCTKRSVNHANRAKNKLISKSVGNSGENDLMKAKDETEE